MSRNRIWLVSSKGGTGKSTVCVNLARAYAAMGLRTLVIDLDAVNRSLDILFGVENDAVYDVSDVLLGRVSASKAAVKLPQSENMYLLCGSDKLPDSFSALTFDAILSAIEKELGITVTFIDTHAPDRNAAVLAQTVTDTLVVSTGASLSLRAAEACGILLRKVDAPRPRLLLNDILLENPERASLLSMIDTAGLQLVGVVPHDDALSAAQETGEMAKEAAEPNTVCSFRNIARRISRANIPLFYDFKDIDRKRVIGI